mmetsp:Transcript_9967/g.25570  ORF Transcript_9967/g.25570 Transcript_9967/m.25570 type:complete len:138 (+) Transcript_9967:288-701(+)
MRAAALAVTTHVQKHRTASESTLAPETTGERFQSRLVEVVGVDRVGSRRGCAAPQPDSDEALDSSEHFLHRGAIFRLFFPAVLHDVLQPLVRILCDAWALVVEDDGIVEPLLKVLFSASLQHAVVVHPRGESHLELI